MDCSSSAIELIWDTPQRHRLKPIEADLTYAAGKYDFLTCKFNADTARKVRNSVDQLNQTHTVEVRANGQLLRTMYFDPQYLKVGKDLRDSDYGGSLELHDLHEFLTSGSINYDFRNETSDVIYTEIFRHRQGEKDPFTSDTPVFNYNVEEENKPEFPDESYELFGGARDKARKSGVSNDTTIDIETGQTPLSAIKQANEELNLSTHISLDGRLVVGAYNGTNSWVANQSGSGAHYILDSAGINQGYKNSLRRINIVGPTEVLGGSSEPGRVALALGSYLNPLDDEERSGYQLRAVVEDPDVESGKIKTINLDNTNPDEIAQAGVRKFKELDSKKQSGKVDLNIPASNVKQSPKLGDTITIPAPENCKLLEEPAYRGDIYIIESVRHKISGDHIIELELSSIPRSTKDLQFRIGYVDNARNETQTFKSVQGYTPKPQGVSFAGSITQEDLDADGDLND